MTINLDIKKMQTEYNFPSLTSQIVWIICIELQKV